jgi:antitoxin ParD1/3/4
MSRSFALGDHLDAFIEREIECGHYDDASEVVRAGLRLLEEQARLRQMEREEIAQLVQEGRRSGTMLPAQEVFDRVEARIKAAMGQNAG